jgi:hypothetical protein
MVGEGYHIVQSEICFGSIGLASILNFIKKGTYYLYISAGLKPVY